MIPTVILAIEDENDRAFMSDLFVRYERLLLAEIVDVLRGRADPEDVLQSTIEKLIDKISLLRGLETRQQVNYIITAARHAAINELRRLKRYPSFSFADIGAYFEQEDTTADVETIVHRHESVDELERVWPSLDERTRYLLEARYFLELSYEEIAAEIGVKPDSARMLLTRARNRVKKLLTGQTAETV